MKKIMTFLGVFLLGGVVGALLLTALMQPYVNNSFNISNEMQMEMVQRHVQLETQALQHLRQGDVAAAQSKLNTLVDEDVLQLAFYVGNGRKLNQPTYQAVALEKAAREQAAYISATPARQPALTAAFDTLTVAR